MDTTRWAQSLIEAFPNLSSDDFEIVEPASERYNCIAYAAGDTTKRWWPNGIDYWPPWATQDNRMESLKEAFAGLGYQQCGDGEVEDDCQKVALYGFQGRFEHTAVQTPCGRWRSKMGRGPLIEHLSLEVLAGRLYGDATTFVRRAAQPTCLHS